MILSAGVRHGLRKESGAEPADDAASAMAPDRRLRRRGSTDAGLVLWPSGALRPREDAASPQLPPMVPELTISTAT